MPPNGSGTPLEGVPSTPIPSAFNVSHNFDWCLEYLRYVCSPFECPWCFCFVDLRLYLALVE